MIGLAGSVQSESEVRIGSNGLSAPLLAWNWRRVFDLGRVSAVCANEINHIAVRIAQQDGQRVSNDNIVPEKVAPRKEDWKRPRSSALAKQLKDPVWRTNGVGRK